MRCIVCGQRQPTKGERANKLTCSVGCSTQRYDSPKPTNPLAGQGRATSGTTLGQCYGNNEKQYGDRLGGHTFFIVVGFGSVALAPLHPKKVSHQVSG